MASSKVVLDADFFRKFTDDEFNTALLEKVLNELGYDAVIHKYVAERELRNNNHLKKLIESNKVEIIGEDEYLSPDDFDDYDEYFRRAYQTLNAIELGDDINIMEYGYKEEVFHESLGEIRSLYLARKKGYGVFLSDDSGARKIVGFLNSKKHHIDVYRVVDVLFRCNEIGADITYKDLKNLFYKLKMANCKDLDALYKCYKKD